MSGLSLIEELEMVARHSGMSREEFAVQFDYFFEAPEEQETYVVKTPRSLILARRIEPGDPDAPEGMPGSTWVVWYAASRGRPLSEFFGWAPRVADYVAFCRPLRGRKVLRYFPWDRISKVCESRE